MKYQSFFCSCFDTLGVIAAGGGALPRDESGPAGLGAAAIAGAAAASAAATTTAGTAPAAVRFADVAH